MENMKLTSAANTDVDEEACKYALQLASFAALPMILKTAIELDLLEIISRKGPGSFLSPADIAAQLPTENPEAPAMLNRILSLLACYNVLTCSLSDKGRLYSAAPVCKFLTKNSDGASISTLSLMIHDKVMMESWYHLKDAVLEGGIPFEIAHGKSIFDYLGTDKRLMAIFNESMRGHTSIIMKKILEQYKGFDNVNVLVDVGGCTGASLKMIISKHAHLKGINYDLPSVIAHAQAYRGIEHVGGDMFVSVPTGDAILMKSVLHDWSHEHCIKILKNCKKALALNGKVIIIEVTLPEAPDSSSSVHVFHVDLVMLAHTTGGRERTLKEFEALAKEAGFSGFKSVVSYSNLTVIELTV